jgi:RES domain-containing protein
MILYRFAHRKFAKDLSGTGARLKGGRWNPPGIPVIYTSENISLALLEILANAQTIEDLRMI